MNLLEPLLNESNSNSLNQMNLVTGNVSNDNEDEMMSIPKSEKQKLSERRLSTVVHMAIDQGKRHLRVIKKRFGNLVTATRKKIPVEVIYCHHRLLVKCVFYIYIGFCSLHFSLFPISCLTL